jgi:hypothetical protein
MCFLMAQSVLVMDREILVDMTGIVLMAFL